MVSYPTRVSPRSIFVFDVHQRHSELFLASDGEFVVYADDTNIFIV